MSAGTHRKVPGRASLPRRTTRGPLDDDEDPLSATTSPASPQPGNKSATLSPLAQSQELPSPALQHEAGVGLLDNEPGRNGPSGAVAGKDLSFLLDRSIFHPLSQVDVPVPFRKPFPGLPPPGSTSTQLLSQVDSTIVKGDLLGAAHLAAMCLSSGLVSPGDYATIFKLLAARYSCLELMGQTILAAQEAKALEDLSSEFYYITNEVSQAELEAHGGQRPVAQHIMPFSMRLQAIRLQNIGFSDPRRGVTMLYDLGLEVRENIISPYTADTDRQAWTKKLTLLNMHVINALIELGDMDCARRTLLQSKPSSPDATSEWSHRMVLMLLKLGQLGEARETINSLDAGDIWKGLLSSVLAIAEGDYSEAIKLLKSAPSEVLDSEMGALIKQNLAVALLYIGEIAEAKALLEGVIRGGKSFPSLTINLSTIFDLTSDKSRDHKVALINKLAQSDAGRRSYTNADFKL